MLVSMLLAGLVTAAAEGPGPFEPPEDATFLCGGHVTGAPQPDGSPGPHITWDAYTSRRGTSTVAAAYRKSLGTQFHRVNGACETWRFPLDKPVRVLEVCPVSENGPWSQCEPIPADAKSIILISTMARSEGAAPEPSEPEGYRP